MPVDEGALFKFARKQIMMCKMMKNHDLNDKYGFVIICIFAVLLFVAYL